MGEKAKKKKRVPKGPTLADRIDKRRTTYANQRLSKAIRLFFTSCDEDDSGFLEAHEFVIAQTVIAEIAGAAFDDDAAKQMFEDIKTFDKSGDNLVDMQEFEQTMMDLVQVIPRNGDEIVNELANRASFVAAQMRREIAMELRKFFRVLDEDNNGYLDEDELESLTKISMECAKNLLGSDEAVQTFFSKDSFDTSKNGKVEVNEFVEHLLEFAKAVKIPKREILSRLRDQKEAAA
uniref:EF-hand domain-containing protein n=1 Tax=Alexandrium catenella TaxID=2925 RepID=A0A7S1RR90_ALECA|mmetsp:Transcript_69891/g.185763  ORF Transcript_69891/g.185763 Transcript_69891/m.185763 type:complete len:235 (+) Transcript_69891:61-765(+)